MTKRCLMETIGAGGELPPSPASSLSPLPPIPQVAVVRL